MYSLHAQREEKGQKAGEEQCNHVRACVCDNNTGGKKRRRIYAYGYVCTVKVGAMNVYVAPRYFWVTQDEVDDHCKEVASHFPFTLSKVNGVGILVTLPK